MARLFGLISKLPVECTISIPPVTPLGRGMHGWGIGWYKGGMPNVEKGKRTALAPTTNQPVSHTVASTVIISHIRFATTGSISEENAHPFQFKSWLFAHSGTVSKEKLFPLLKPPYNQEFQSEPVDSEVYFRFVLQSMKEQGEKPGLQLALCQLDSKQEGTFLLSDGETLYGFSKGIPLYWLLWRGAQAFAGQSTTTGSLYQSSQMATTSGFFISSDRLTQDNWKVMDSGELIIVRKNLQYELVRISTI